MFPKAPTLFDDHQISCTLRGSKTVSLKLAGQAVIPQVKLIGECEKGRTCLVGRILTSHAAWCCIILFFFSSFHCRRRTRHSTSLCPLFPCPSSLSCHSQLCFMSLCPLHFRCPNISHSLSYTSLRFFPFRIFFPLRPSNRGLRVPHPSDPRQRVTHHCRPRPRPHQVPWLRATHNRTRWGISTEIMKSIIHIGIPPFKLCACYAMNCSIFTVLGTKSARISR